MPNVLTAIDLNLINICYPQRLCYDIFLGMVQHLFFTDYSRIVQRLNIGVVFGDLRDYVVTNSVNTTISTVEDICVTLLEPESDCYCTTS